MDTLEEKEAAAAERKLRNTLEGVKSVSPTKSIIYTVKRDSAFDK